MGRTVMSGVQDSRESSPACWSCTPVNAKVLQGKWNLLTPVVDPKATRKDSNEFKMGAEFYSSHYIL